MKHLAGFLALSFFASSAFAEDICKLPQRPESTKRVVIQRHFGFGRTSNPYMERSANQAVNSAMAGCSAAIRQDEKCQIVSNVCTYDGGIHGSQHQAIAERFVVVKEPMSDEAFKQLNCDTVTACIEKWVNNENAQASSFEKLEMLSKLYCSGT